MVAATRFNYTFSVWPNETWGFDPAVFKVFKTLHGRVELCFSPEEFETFRSGLSSHGLTLREIERTPYIEPEPVP
ncbi:MAG: hypothetical protein K8T91_24955 [Planctomycetes bacterium]|nr:hypothetical protein [Planctomycetota bacterium]